MRALKQLGGGVVHREPRLLSQRFLEAAVALHRRAKEKRPAKGGPLSLRLTLLAAVLPAAAGRLGMAARVAEPAATVVVVVVATARARAATAAAAAPVIVVVVTARTGGARMAFRITEPAAAAMAATVVVVIAATRP